MMSVPVYTLPTTLSSAAETILTAAGDALDASGITKFGYRVIVPGREVPVEENNLLAVVLRTMHPGRIGIQQYAGQLPGENTWPQNVMGFSVELWTPTPLPVIGPISTYRPPARGAMNASAVELMDAGFVVMVALETEQRANELFPTAPMLVGPLEPVGGLGGVAGVTISVQIQLP